MKVLLLLLYAYLFVSYTSFFFFLMKCYFILYNRNTIMTELQCLTVKFKYEVLFLIHCPATMTSFVCTYRLFGHAFLICCITTCVRDFKCYGRTKCLFLNSITVFYWYQRNNSSIQIIKIYLVPIYFENLNIPIN